MEKGERRPVAVPIENLIFDIGVVLLHLDYERALARLLPQCDPRVAGALNSRSFFGLIDRDPAVAEYERGRISPEAFYRHFVSRTGYRGPYEEFAELWYDILSENRPMIEFARDLAHRYPVYLATNAGALHIPRLYQDFPALDFRRDAVASCELGAIKPEPAFYERMLRRFGLAAAACLFVDDRSENVEGARACGLRAIRYTDPPRTISAIRAVLERTATDGRLDTLRVRKAVR